MKVGLVEHLPVNGVDMLLGNDLVKGDKIALPIVRTEPVREVDVCVTTRSGASTDEEDLDLVFGNCNGDLVSSLPPQVNLQREGLIKEQREDESLKPYFEKARLLDSSLGHTKPAFCVRDNILHMCCSIEIVIFLLLSL